MSKTKMTFIFGGGGDDDGNSKLLDEKRTVRKLNWLTFGRSRAAFIVGCRRLTADAGGIKLPACSRCITYYTVAFQTVNLMREQ